MLEEAKQSKDLAEVHDLLGKWRHFAYAELKEPGRYFGLLAKAERRQSRQRPVDTAGARRPDLSARWGAELCGHRGRHLADTRDGVATSLTPKLPGPFLEIAFVASVPSYTKAGDGGAGLTLTESSGRTPPCRVRAEPVWCRVGDSRTDLLEDDLRLAPSTTTTTCPSSYPLASVSRCRSEVNVQARPVVGALDHPPCWGGGGAGGPGVAVRSVRASAGARGCR